MFSYHNDLISWHTEIMNGTKGEIKVSHYGSNQITKRLKHDIRYFE